MIKLLAINGAIFFRIFKEGFQRSEIYLSNLHKSSRQRLVSLTVKENFSQVVFVDPILDNHLNCAIENLAQAGLNIFVISNQRIRTVPQNHEELKKENAIILLEYLLPNNSICVTSDTQLLELVTQLTEKKNFYLTRTLIVANFSSQSVIAALKILGFPYDQNNHSEALRHETSLEFNIRSPINSLEDLLKTLEQDNWAKEFGADRSEIFQTICERLLIL